jgi:hypothetical protein
LITCAKNATLWEIGKKYFERWKRGKVLLIFERREKDGFSKSAEW